MAAAGAPAPHGAVACSGHAPDGARASSGGRRAGEGRGVPVGGKILTLPLAKRLCGAAAAAGLRQLFTGAFWPSQPPDYAEALSNTLHLFLSRVAGVRLRAPQQ